jgi:periplasmic protein TonB
MFDRYVAQTKPSWKRRALVLGSVGLHLVVLIAALIYMLLHIEEIAPPALSLTFFSAAPPPPPPPPPPKASTPHVEKKVTPKVQPTQVVQPTDVKPIVQPKQEEKEEEDDGEEGGQEGGVKGGVAGGVAGGVVGGVVGGTVGGAGVGKGGPASPPKMVASITLMAQQLQHPDPHLPDWFRNQHANQTVRGVYKVCLRQDGHVGDVYPLTSIPGMDQTVIEQIKGGWVYKPQPVPVCTASVILFKIN